MTKWCALDDIATKETQKSDVIGCSLFGCAVYPQLPHQEEDLAWSNGTLVVHRQVVGEMIHSIACLLDKH